MNKRLLLRAAVLLCLSLPILKARKWSCAAQIGTTAYSGDVGEHLNWQPNLIYCFLLNGLINTHQL